VPVLGYSVNTCDRLRLWAAEASESFDFQAFNTGDFHGAVEQKVTSETLSKVLYPNDGTDAGRRLRLKQQFFFVSCSLQDMLRNLTDRGIAVTDFADHWAVQLNDTHPSIGVAELMRLLLDEHQLGWDEAWSITHRAIAYTNHTLLPEALECWDLEMFAEVLPRHLELIYEINDRFLQTVRRLHPGNLDLQRRVSIIGEDGRRTVRMAHLATVAAHHINGVAALHSKLVVTSLLPDFAALFPERFTNVTNGVTPRRWLALANPPLNALLLDVLGPGWPGRTESLRELAPLANDPSFQERWARAKYSCKEHLAAHIKEHSGLVVNPSSLFDVQVKRIHEYKRQHLNALQVIGQYLRIRSGDVAHVVPRTVIFGGKAAPGYAMAKLIIRLINGVASMINNDPACHGLLQVVFLADYNVKLGEKVYPAADLSEQISTAGLEASGTGNMKFTMNGALTIGTLDGANVEIRDQVGKDHFFLFGRTTDEIQTLSSDYQPWEWLDTVPWLREALQLIEHGHFSGGDPELFKPLVENLVGRDPFFVLADLGDYCRAQDEVSALWRDQTGWQGSSILNSARSGFFSSDRSIRTYAEQIWNVKSLAAARH
jgi:starch phosphorylase